MQISLKVSELSKYTVLCRTARVKGEDYTSVLYPEASVLYPELLFYIQNILILVESFQLSCILPGSGLLDPILALDFPTKRDLYNLK